MRRRAVTFVAAVLVLIGAWAMPAAAAPGDPTTPPDEGGANQTLGEKLDSANTEWLQAQATLDASKKRQAELVKKMEEMQKELEPIRANVNIIAAAAYRTGGKVRMSSALV